MKKIGIFVVATLLMSITTFAQEQPCRRMNPEERSKARTEKMVKDYKLDENQAKQVEALNAELIEKDRPHVRGDRDNRPSREEMAKMQEMRKANREVYDQRLKEVLNAEQYEAYLKDEAKVPDAKGNRDNNNRSGKKK